MSEKKFKESDVVINTQNGKEYYITQIEKVYDADLKHLNSNRQCNSVEFIVS